MIRRRVHGKPRRHSALYMADQDERTPVASRSCDFHVVNCSIRYTWALNWPSPRSSWRCTCLLPMSDLPYPETTTVLDLHRWPAECVPGKEKKRRQDSGHVKITWVSNARSPRWKCQCVLCLTFCIQCSAKRTASNNLHTCNRPGGTDEYETAWDIIWEW